MPLPNAQAVPGGLPARLAPAVARGMTARVRLRHPDQVPVRDPVTGKTSFTPAPPYYDGPARVQAHGGGPPAATPADRHVGSGGYLVAVPHTVIEARPYDLVEVVADGQDPALAGLLLVVDDVPTASLILQRNLSCSRHTGAAAGT
jgi:hypothetical protein